MVRNSIRHRGRTKAYDEKILELDTEYNGFCLLLYSASSCNLY